MFRPGEIESQRTGDEAFDVGAGWLLTGWEDGKSW